MKQQKKSLAERLATEASDWMKRIRFLTYLDYSIERQGKQWEKNILNLKTRNCQNVGAI